MYSLGKAPWRARSCRCSRTRGPSPAAPTVTKRRAYSRIHGTGPPVVATPRTPSREALPPPERYLVPSVLTERATRLQFRHDGWVAGFDAPPPRVRRDSRARAHGRIPPGVAPAPAPFPPSTSSPRRRHARLLSARGRVPSATRASHKRFGDELGEECEALDVDHCRIRVYLREPGAVEQRTARPLCQVQSSHGKT